MRWRIHDLIYLLAAAAFALPTALLLACARDEVSDRAMEEPSADGAPANRRVVATAPASSSASPIVSSATRGRPDPARRDGAVQRRGIPAGTAAPFPDETAPVAPQDAGAAILRRAAAAYERVRSLKAGFTMVTENPLLRSTTTSRGVIYQRSPDRIKLDFTEPAGDVIVGDGTYFWIYYPSVDDKQVLRTRAAQGSSGGVDLRAQFVGDPVQTFRYTLHGAENVDGREANVLTLLPNEDLGYQQLKVWIDARDALARRFEIVEHNGVTRRFRLESLEINPALDDGIFRFTPPPGARIIDRG
jgi:outer membrane lipoprotein carrier protein